VSAVVRRDIKIGIKSPHLCEDPDTGSEVVRRVLRAARQGLLIRTLVLERDRIMAVLTVPLGTTPAEEQRLAEQFVQVVRDGYGAAELNGTILSPVGSWAFGADKRELSPDQRSRVAQEIRAMANEVAPHERDLVLRIAEKVGRK
jgi:hypothetical protein